MHNTLWFLFPLSAGISLVWCASHYESPATILIRSAWLFGRIVGTMLLLVGSLYLLSAGL